MDSIIFDVDGTLWNSTEIVAKAWSQVLDGEPDIHVEITAATLIPLFGKVMSEIAQSLFPQQTPQQRSQLMEKCYVREHELLMRESAPLYDRLEETLNLLSQKYPLYIVSNCQSGYIQVFLASTGLSSYFQGHLCPGDTGKLKAENIRQIIQTYHLKSPIYVGDTLGDYTACREAEVPFVYAAYGFGQVPASDYAIQCPYDLVRLFL